MKILGLMLHSIFGRGIADVEFREIKFGRHVAWPIFTPSFPLGLKTTPLASSADSSRRDTILRGTCYELQPCIDQVLRLSQELQVFVWEVSLILSSKDLMLRSQDGSFVESPNSLIPGDETQDRPAAAVTQISDRGRLLRDKKLKFKACGIENNLQAVDLSLR